MAEAGSARRLAEGFGFAAYTGFRDMEWASWAWGRHPQLKRSTSWACCIYPVSGERNSHAALRTAQLAMSTDWAGVHAGTMCTRSWPVLAAQGASQCFMLIIGALQLASGGSLQPAIITQRLIAAASMDVRTAKSSWQSPASKLYQNFGPHDFHA